MDYQAWGYMAIGVAAMAIFVLAWELPTKPTLKNKITYLASVIILCSSIVLLRINS